MQKNSESPITVMMRSAGCEVFIQSSGLLQSRLGGQAAASRSVAYRAGKNDAEALSFLEELLNESIHRQVRCGRGVGGRSGDDAGRGVRAIRAGDNRGEP